MTPTCRSGVELLMEYVEGTLASDLGAAIEGHVAGCARCRAFVESYRRTPAILRRATDVELPPELARGLDAWLQEIERGR